jgi:hypothetical protein
MAPLTNSKIIAARKGNSKKAYSSNVLDLENIGVPPRSWRNSIRNGSSNALRIKVGTATPRKGRIELFVKIHFSLQCILSNTYVFLERLVGSNIEL